jgi:hypothetical protein
MRDEQEQQQEHQQEHDFWEIWFSSPEVLEKLEK